MPSDRDDQPRRSRRRDDDDDRDDDLDEERPRRSRARSEPKGKSHLALFLGLGGGAVALVLLAAAAFVWPGFARRDARDNGVAAGGGGGDAPAAGNELWSLAPADSLFVAGISLAQARKTENFKQQLAQSRKLLEDGGAPAQLIDIILDADRLFAAGTIRQGKPIFIVSLRTLNPYDPEKFKKSSLLGPAETDKGATFHRVQVPGPGDASMKDVFLAMPDPKLLVLGIMPKDDFVKALEGRAWKPAMPADLLTACRTHENKYFWAALVNQGELKDKIDQIAWQARQTARKDKQREIAILSQASSASIAFDVVPKEGLSLEVNMTCGKPEDGEELKKIATDNWKSILGLAELAIANAGPETAIFKKVLDEVKSSFQVSQHSGAMKASVRVSETVMTDLEKQLVPALQKLREATQGTAEQPPAVPVVLMPGSGTIRGRVIYDGTPPEAKELPANFAATKGCEAPPDQQFQNRNQTWIVGKDKAVANVLVVLKPLQNQQFAPAPKRMDQVVIDQPFCAFVPHVVTIKPGQKLVVKNSSELLRFIRIRGNPLNNNPQKEGAIPAGKEEIYPINPQKEPLNVWSDNHPWMEAKVWALSHPYSAVTDQDGNFKIDNVPTGVKLSVAAWHEAVEFFHSEDVIVQPKETKTVSFSIRDKGRATLSQEGNKIRAVYKNSTERDIKVDKQVIESGILALEVRARFGAILTPVPPSVLPAKAEFVVIPAGKEYAVSYDVQTNFSPPLAPGSYTVRSRLSDWISQELHYVVGNNKGD